MRLSVVVALGLVALVCATVVPTSIENNVYDARTGSMVLLPINGRLQKNIYMVVNKDLPTSELKDVDVAEMLSHHLGLSPLHPQASRMAFGSANIWNRPKANVMVAISGVDKEKAATLKVARGSGVNVEMNSYPYDTLTAFTTLLTGEHADKHGIVGKQWINHNGESVTAFRTAEGLPASASLVDVASQTHEKPLVLSFSYDPQFALAGGVHSLSHKEDQLVFHYDTAAQRIVSAYPSPESSKFSLSKEDILSTIGESILRNFDSSSESDLAFLVEYAFIHHILNSIEQSSVSRLIADDIPDSFVFSLQSPQLISDSYGKNSVKFNEAVHLFDNLITKMLDNFNTLYPERVLSEIVFLGESDKIEFSKEVLDIIAPYSQAPQEFLPYLYNFDLDSEFLCSKVSGLLSTHQVEAFCLDVAGDLTFRKSNVTQTPPHTGGYTTNQVAGIQTLLWSSVFILIAALAGVALVCAVDIPQESILIRSTPNLFKDNLDLHNM